MELFFAVVDKMADSADELSFRHGLGYTKGLKSLCRVNHATRALAEPLLYSIVYLKKGNMRLFRQAISSGSTDGRSDGAPNAKAKWV